MSQVKQIGLFGFGVVGEGIYQVLNQKPQLGIGIAKVVIRDANKERNAPASLFSTQPKWILDDPSIDWVVELIDDAEAAYTIVKTALENGKSVVSANKKMIASHLPELKALAEARGLSFLYEAAVCGSIPVIRNLEEYFDSDLIGSVSGIINGSTNYILTQMSKQGWGFEQALQEAQEAGFAESDPSLDVEGLDARNKLKILILHAFGFWLQDSQIGVQGIHRLNTFDLTFAKEKGFEIKLISKAELDEQGGVSQAYVLPSFVPRQHPFAQTHNEFNGVLIGSALSDQQFLYGKGAGRFPTSSAVLSDLSALKYGYRYAYKKQLNPCERLGSKVQKFYVRYQSGSAVPEFSPHAISERYVGKTFSYMIVEGHWEELYPLIREKDVGVVVFPD